MIPPKLKRGDEVRVISPSVSLSVVSDEVEQTAVSRLNALGLKVTISKHARETDDFSSSSVASRIEDLHEAFLDPEVKGIFTTLGGHNANQLLTDIDYGLVQSNPKILCGYSDITALSAAIYKKTGLVTYSGPHFSTFGMKKGNDYTIDYMVKCLFEEGGYSVIPSGHWSDDKWYIDQADRDFITNRGREVIREGTAEGTLIGGNLCTLNLLQGTPFMPSIRQAVLFLEDDEASRPETFDRDLQSLLHQTGGEEIRGLVIGKFQRASQMTSHLLKQIIESKKELRGVPVITEADFGHTSPMITFPVGGRAHIIAEHGRTMIRILEH